MQYAEFKLEKPTCEHLLSALRKDTSLSRALAVQIENNIGTMCGLLPAGTPIEAVRQIEWGGVAGSDGATEYLHKVVADCAKEKPDVTVFVNDSVASPDDPIVAKSPWKPWIFGKEVYYNVPNAVHQFDLFKRLIWFCHSAALWGVVGVVTVPPQAPSTAHRTELSQASIEMMARNTLLAFVGAYDGESYIIWRPDSAAHDAVKLGAS